MADETLRPRRSVLYMPAANERALAKAKEIAADAIIFDLEDAVAPDAKEAARANAVAEPARAAARARFLFSSIVGFLGGLLSGVARLAARGLTD